MRQADVATLLALANSHDPRQRLDDIRVQGWWDLLQQEAPDMPYEFARERINRHYALMTEMLMPAHLITAWRTHKQRGRDRAAIPAGRGVPMPEYVREQIRRTP